MTELTHLDEYGRPKMVDVSEKAISRRIAKAEGFIRLQKETLRRIQTREIAKGNVLVCAELAGIQGAKATSGLIPLCHPLPLSGIAVRAEMTEGGVVVNSEVKCTARTGAEMEALTAATIALLTVYDMCKAVDKNMEITRVTLVEKSKEVVVPGDARGAPAPAGIDCGGGGGK